MSAANMLRQRTKIK